MLDYLFVCLVAHLLIIYYLLFSHSFIYKLYSFKYTINLFIHLIHFFSSHLVIEGFSMVFTAGGEKGGIRGIFGVQIAYLNTDNR